MKTASLVAHVGGAGPLLLGAFAVALAACGLIVMPRSERSIPTAAASLEIVPHDMIVEGEGPKDVLFTIRNRGDIPVVVTHVIAHCHCTVAGLPDPSTVLPGGESRLRVRATPPDVGEKRTSIDIRYRGDGDASLSASLLLRGRQPAAPSLVNQPYEAVIRGLLGSTSSADFHLSAIERRGAKKWIEGLESDAAEVSATIDNIEDLPGSTGDTVRRIYQCRATAKLAARGRRQLALLRLRCGSPSDGPALQPIKIMSDCMAPIEAVPDTIFASLGRAGLPKEFRIRFRSPALGHALEIAPEAGAAWLEIDPPIATADDSPFAAEIRVRVVDLPNALDGQMLRTTVCVSTNAPNYPKVEIPVVIQRRD